MELSQVKKLKAIEEELSQFKRMYADLAFENNALKNLIEKKLSLNLNCLFFRYSKAKMTSTWSEI